MSAPALPTKSYTVRVREACVVEYEVEATSADDAKGRVLREGKCPIRINLIGMEVLNARENA